MFSRNLSKLLRNYTATCPRRHHSLLHLLALFWNTFRTYWYSILNKAFRKLIHFHSRVKRCGGIYTYELVRKTLFIAGAKNTSMLFFNGFNWVDVSSPFYLRRDTDQVFKTLCCVRNTTSRILTRQETQEDLGFLREHLKCIQMICCL
jgi:hypothetical protein